MRIVLTGGTGFIGSRLLQLLSKSQSNRILLISRKKQKSKFNNKIEHLNCSLDSLNKRKQKIINFNPDILIHLAWDKIPIFNKINSKINEKNTKNLIRIFCKHTKVKHILISGSCFEVRPPNKSYNNFIDAKKQILNFLKKKSKQYKIRYNWLRFFYVYGPGQREGSLIPSLIKCIMNQKIANIKEPNKRYDFIFIDDVCKSIISAIKFAKKSDILEIGSGKMTRIKKIINILKKLSNNKLKYSLNNKSKKNSIYKANIHKAKKEIFWKPSTDILVGLRKTFKSY